MASGGNALLDSATLKIAAAHSFAEEATVGLRSTAGCVLGDSTIASFGGANAVTAYLLTDADLANGCAVTSHATSAEGITGQLARWVADANKATYDWIVVQVGLNDCDPAETAADALARYQTMITTINAGKKSTAKVIVATMTPCKSRWPAVFPADPAGAQAKWLAMNTGIMGGGANAITGVNFRVNAHTAALADVDGNLSLFVDQGDHIHETNAGRQIIANAWRACMTPAGLLPAQPAAPISPAYVELTVLGKLASQLKRSVTETVAGASVVVLDADLAIAEDEGFIVEGCIVAAVTDFILLRLDGAGAVGESALEYSNGTFGIYSQRADVQIGFLTVAGTAGRFRATVGPSIAGKRLITARYWVEDEVGHAHTGPITGHVTVGAIATSVGITTVSSGACIADTSTITVTPGGISRAMLGA